MAFYRLHRREHQSYREETRHFVVTGRIADPPNDPDTRIFCPTLRKSGQKVSDPKYRRLAGGIGRSSQVRREGYQTKRIK